MRGRVAAVLMVALSAPLPGFGASVAAASPAPATLSGQSAGIITAILVGSAATQAAVDKSDMMIRQLFEQKRAAEQEKVRALRQAGLSDRARAQLQAELAAARHDLERLLAQLAAKDAECAAKLRAYREGLTGLLADNGC